MGLWLVLTSADPDFFLFFLNSPSYFTEGRTDLTREAIWPSGPIASRRGSNCFSMGFCTNISKGTYNKLCFSGWGVNSLHPPPPPHKTHKFWIRRWLGLHWEDWPSIYQDWFSLTHANNKGADQPVQHCSLVKAFVIRFMANRTYKLLICKIIIFWPVSVAEYFLRGSRKFCQKGSNSDKFFFFFFYEEKEDPNSTKSGPSSARQRNAIKCRFAGGPMVA